MILSSAKNKWEICGPWGQADAALRSPIDMAWFRSANRHSAEKKQGWGDGIPLSQAPRRGYVTLGFSINSNRVGNNGNTLHHKIYPFFIKAHFFHNFF